MGDFIKYKFGSLSLILKLAVTPNQSLLDNRTTSNCEALHCHNKVFLNAEKVISGNNKYSVLRQPNIVGHRFDFYLLYYPLMPSCTGLVTQLLNNGKNLASRISVPDCTIQAGLCSI